MSNVVEELKEVAERVAKLAAAHGADAEVLVRDGSELVARVRLGKPELVQEAGSRALGLRVFVDKRSAVTYTSDLRNGPLETFVADSVALARVSEPDELNYLPEDGELPVELPELDLYDARCEAIDAAHALDQAIRGEKAALDSDSRVTNSEGGSYSRVLGAMAFANSAGFVGGYRGSYVSMSVEPVCDEPDGKKRNGSWWTAGRHLDQLDSPEEVGVEAARRTVRQLGPIKLETGTRCVIFDPDVGRALLSTLFGVANGSAFYRKSSYLLDREGTLVASPLVTIIDDPLIPRAPGSRAFDGDGLPTRKNTMVKEGILETVLCDTYSARKLGRPSTRSAGRGVGGNPGPTSSNLYVAAGQTDTNALLAESNGAFYVTSLMGFGFNPVTGDFSRGASGFLVEDGKLGQPVSEVTISANFDDILKGIDRVCNDLEMRSSISCPTLRVMSMTVAGR